MQVFFDFFDQFLDVSGKILQILLVWMWVLFSRLTANGLLYKPALSYLVPVSLVVLLYTTAAEVLLKERLESRETQRQERMMNRWLVIGTC